LFFANLQKYATTLNNKFFSRESPNFCFSNLELLHIFAASQALMHARTRANVDGCAGTGVKSAFGRESGFWLQCNPA